MGLTARRWGDRAGRTGPRCTGVAPAPARRLRATAAAGRGARREAVRASLGLMRDLAHDAVAVPLLIAPYRAALGGADYTVALVGQTTIGKTALAQQRRGIADCGLWISD